MLGLPEEESNGCPKEGGVGGIPMLRTQILVPREDSGEGRVV